MACPLGTRGFDGAAGVAIWGVIGDAANGCQPNTINGSINLNNNTGGLVVIGNSYTGSLNAAGNSGSGPLPGETTPIIKNNVHT